MFNRPLPVLSGLLIAVLAVLNLLLLDQNRRLQAGAGTFPGKRNAPSAPKSLWLAAGCPLPLKSLLQEKRPNRSPILSLLVFLHREDCGVCLEEAEVWERLYKRFSPKGFSVLGIVGQEDSLWADQFAKDYELTFPIAILDSGLLENLGIPPVTPFKAMVDSLRRVVWFSGPNSEPAEQKSFWEVAEKLCRAYLSPG